MGNKIEEVIDQLTKKCLVSDVEVKDVGKAAFFDIIKTRIFVSKQLEAKEKEIRELKQRNKALKAKVSFYRWF